MTKSWLFLKKFQTSLLFSSENTLLLSAAWAVLQSKQSLFQRIFFKKGQFIVISDEKRKLSKHHFSQKVRETDRLQSVFYMFDSYINQCQELMVPVDLILAGNQGNHQINFVPSLISIQEALTDFYYQSEKK